MSAVFDGLAALPGAQVQRLTARPHIVFRERNRVVTARDEGDGSVWITAKIDNGGGATTFLDAKTYRSLRAAVRFVTEML